VILADDVFDLATIVREVAQRDPERIAVIEPDGRDAAGRRRYRRHSYRQLSDEVEAVAPGLREMGIAERTRTVFMAPPSYGASVVALALSRVGSTTIWIDPSVGYRNVGERLRRIAPEAFVGIPISHLGRLVFGWGPRTLRKLVVVGDRGFPGARTIASLRRPAPAAPAAPAVGPDDPCAILYTTGSTGPAKPALYLHRNYAQLYRIVHQSWRFAESEGVPVDMAIFPAFFLISLSAGGTLVVPPIDFVRQTPAKADPHALLEVINDCGVRTCFGSPVLLENMARHAVEHRITTPTLQRVIGGGAPIFAGVKRALLEAMGDRGEVFANYGATEALPTSEMSARETLGETWAHTQQGAGLCVGRPFAGVELRIVRMVDGVLAKLTDAEELPAGEIGEILVRSPHVSPAYFRDEDSTRKNKTYGPGGEIWHRIGDAGYLDEQGRLWYCGRAGQRVRAKDGPLFSLQCEPIFDAHPAVRRSGLVGVPDGASELPVLCAELIGRPDAAARAALRGELRRLAAARPVTRQIRHLLFPDALPVDPRHNSKIERPALARWAAAQLRNPAIRDEAER